jgi:hypothetical protein
VLVGVALPGFDARSRTFGSTSFEDVKTALGAEFTAEQASSLLRRCAQIGMVRCVHVTLLPASTGGCR